jgi:hypothetical protein
VSAFLSYYALYYEEVKIGRNIYLLFIAVLVSFNVTGQDVTVIEEDIVIEGNFSAIPGINLVQNGDQNIANVKQIQSFSSQLSLYQEGNYNSALIFQSGSGNLSISQTGSLNRTLNLLAGEEVDIEIYQEGLENSVRQLSLGNNSTYQFIQLGTQNSIDHFNFGGNDKSLFIQQKGSDMHISIYSN